jgi:flagellin-like protein
MKNQNDRAVSPVVGVMLMLVVTIIIAAVVSGFAGGLIGSNNQKTPALTMDVRIVNSG